MWPQMQFDESSEQQERHRTHAKNSSSGAAIDDDSLRDDGSDGVKEIDYGDMSYWDHRYRHDREPFDWFGGLGPLTPWVREAAFGHERIVHLGCGTSELPEQMHDAGGYGEIHNVDCSPACLDLMRARNAPDASGLGGRPGLFWHLADVTDMHDVLEDGAFGCALDKSTLDAVCDGGRDAEAARYVAEVARLLRPEGTFLVFSFAPPGSRLRHLEGAGLFRCRVEVVQDLCFAYTCRKNAAASRAIGEQSSFAMSPRT